MSDKSVLCKGCLVLMVTWSLLDHGLAMNGHLTSMCYSDLAVGSIQASRSLTNSFPKDLPDGSIPCRTSAPCLFLCHCTHVLSLFATGFWIEWALRKSADHQTVLCFTILGQPMEHEQGCGLTILDVPTTGGSTFTGGTLQPCRFGRLPVRHLHQG